MMQVEEQVDVYRHGVSGMTKKKLTLWEFIRMLWLSMQARTQEGIGYLAWWV